MNRTSSHGYILLEVVIAVAVVAVALGVLIESLGRCLAAAHSVQNYAMAETLLANKSAEFRTELAADTGDQEGDFEEYPLFHVAQAGGQRHREALETNHHHHMDRARPTEHGLGGRVPVST